MEFFGMFWRDINIVEHFSDRKMNNNNTMRHNKRNLEGSGNINKIFSNSTNKIHNLHYVIRWAYFDCRTV